MALVGGYGLGSIITFRYNSPTSHDKAPMVLLLTNRHRDGYIHGINLRYVTPLQQQQLQYYFRSQAERARDYINPFKQRQIEKYQQELEQKKKELQTPTQEQQGYIIRPAPKSDFGVSTFTKTDTAVVQQARGALGRLKRYVPFGGQEEPQQQEPPPQQQQPETYSQLADVNKQTVPVVNDPLVFYNQYVKPILFPNTHFSYRKYNPRYVSGLRIIKGVPNV